MTTESFMGCVISHSKGMYRMRQGGERPHVSQRARDLGAPSGLSANPSKKDPHQKQHQEPHQKRRTEPALSLSKGVSVPHRTILGWKRVPATRVAMASSSLWPLKTLTCGARESSGRFTVRPLRMRAALGSSAVTDGSCGSNLRGWTNRSSREAG